MPLGQPPSIGIHSKPAMKPCWILIAQCAVQQNLPGRRLQQIRAAHHLGNPHCGIVGYAGKLVTRFSIPSPDDEIPKIHTRHKSLRAQIQILKLDRFAVGNAKAPIEPLARFRPAHDRVVPAYPGVDRLAIQRILILARSRCPLMRSSQRCLQIFA